MVGLRSVCLCLALSAGLVLAPSGCRADQPELTRTERIRVSGGFDLSKHSIPPEQILSGGPPKDGIPALDSPRMTSADEAAFLADDDLVVGVEEKGQSSAYPLRILNWHEIVNDKIGDSTVAVTYCPLTASAVVFDRKVDGRELSFGVSGRLYRSNVLMFDRETESLWSQLAQMAVTGENTGNKLRPIPSALTTWRNWRDRHPNTRVLSATTGHRRDYTRDPYESYAQSQSLMFPVGSLDTRYTPKSRVLGLVVEGKAYAHAFDSLHARKSPLRRNLAGHTAIIEAEPGGGRATIDGQPVPLTLAYWFAWSAFHPDTELWTGGADASTADPRETAKASLSDVEGYWTSLSAASIGGTAGEGVGPQGLFIVRGFVRNETDNAVNYVTLRFELLDSEGRVVYFEEGINRSAERILDTAAFGGTEPTGSICTAAIPHGGTDTFRMAFVGSEIPVFSDHRVVILSVVSREEPPR